MSYMYTVHVQCTLCNSAQGDHVTISTCMHVCVCVCVHKPQA